MQLDNVNLIKFKELDSTNDYVKQNHQNLTNLTFVKTDFQTKGRGKLERVWKSEPKKNLLFSVLLKDVNHSKIQDLKEVVKLSLLKLLNQYKIKGVFKQPNDILVKGKKILGILIETQTNSNSSIYEYVVVGIGININQTKFPNLDATSFKKILNKEVLVKEVYTNFIKIFTENISGIL